MAGLSIPPLFRLQAEDSFFFLSTVHYFCCSRPAFSPAVSAQVNSILPPPRVNVFTRHVSSLKPFLLAGRRPFFPRFQDTVPNWHTLRVFSDWENTSSSLGTRETRSAFSLLSLPRVLRLIFGDTTFVSQHPFGTLALKFPWRGNTLL